MKKYLIGQAEDAELYIQKQAEADALILDAQNQVCSSSVMGRRKFLGTVGAVTAGLFLGVEDSEAAFLGVGNYSADSVPGIPASWVKAKGLNVNRYANYVKSLRLRNITPRMVLASHFKIRKGIVNTLPPRNSWKKMGPTLKVIDRLSREMGVPLRSIVSAYRSPRYNRAVRGKSHSYHMANQAIDVQFHGASPRHVASVARYLRKKGKFTGGVGLYQTFVHVDTRGYVADW